MDNWLKGYLKPKNIKKKITKGIEYAHAHTCIVLHTHTETVKFHAETMKIQGAKNVHMHIETLKQAKFHGPKNKKLYEVKMQMCKPP